jgi:outer membrane protein
MDCDIFRIHSFLIFLLRAGLIAVTLIILSFGARAQDIVPTPAPTPITTPTIEPTITPTPTATPTPQPTALPTPALTTQTDGRERQQPMTPETRLNNVPAVAPGFESNKRALPELGRVGVDMNEPRPMTVRDAIELALSNNKDIEVARQNVRISEFDLTAARGVYEPRFFSQSFYERSTVPSASFFTGGADGKLTQSNFTTNTQLQGQEGRFGGNYLVQFNNSRLTSSNPFNTLDPQFTTNLNFQYAQPLFRGRRFDQNRRLIEIAKKNLSLTDAQFRQRTIEIINNVQRAYWDLTFALKNLQVQRDSLKDAREQLESNRRRVEEGLLAPIDAVAVETQVANLEQGVYEALNTVSVAENNLKNLIAPSRTDDLWSKSVVPVDTVDVEAPNVALPDALNEALKNRPELELNDVQQAINDIDQRFYREQTKPQVDLIANFNLAGLAGSEQNVVNPLSGSSDATRQKINEIIGQVNQLNNNQPGLPDIPLLPATPTTGDVPENLTGGLFNSLTNVAALRYPTFRVGVQINLPFETRTARAQFGRSLVEGERLDTQRAQLEQLIQLDVRNALQLIRTAEARLRSAAIARENGERQYDSERRKFDEGQSTVFLVLERQTALTNARGAELRAQTELNKAIADLQRATGNSLRANNIVARVR